MNTTKMLLLARTSLWSARTLQVVLSAGLAVSAFACACNRAPSVTAPTVAQKIGGTPDSATVVAEVGDLKITMGQLNEHVAPQLRELDEQQFEIRRQGLDQMVNQHLVRAAAAKEGKTEQDYLKAMIDTKVTPPTEEQIKTFFAQNSAQLPPGAKLDDFRERIVTFIGGRAHSERARELFAQLRREAKVTVHLKPPPQPRLDVEAKGPSRGPASAKVTLVEFSDFECAFCRDAKMTVDEVMKKFDGKVRLVFRQFPLSFHAHARKAAEAALCAHVQGEGKFWAYHDALFEDQAKLEPAELKKTAARLGLDATAFAKCLDDGEQSATVDADMAAAEKLGVSGTPAFFIDGMILSGAKQADEFERIIQEELDVNG